MAKEKNGLICPLKRIRTDIVQHIQPEDEIAEEPLTYIPRRTNPKNYRFLNCALGCEEITAFDGCEWVSDFLENEEWLPGEFIFISAGTGKGKNVFVEKLAETGETRTCILSNRKVNRDQLAERMQIKHNSFVFSKTVLMSYQQLEMNTSIGCAELESFDVIVCDEAHYWETDSSYNNRAPVSLEKVLGTRRPIKLFMSATLDGVLAYILSRLRNDPNRPVDSAFYCKYYKMAANCFNFSSVNSADWNYVLEKIKKSEHRWLCFVDSKATGLWLQEQLGKDSLFIDSEGSMKNGKVAKEIEFITKNEAFRPKTLVSTSILDNGINLKMSDLKGIVIDCNNRNQLIQMAGRKRPQNTMDMADLYLIEQPRKKLLDQLRRLDVDYAGYIRFKHELDLYGWPNTSFSQNSLECDQYRNRMTWSESEKLFHFNYLGFNEIQMKRSQLGTLLESDNPFSVKVNWLFGDLPPMIGVTMEQIIYSRNQQLINILSKYAEEAMPIKSDEVLAFREEFTQSYLEINGSDVVDGVRSNRMLSIPQIQEVVKKYSLPIEIRKFEKNRKVHVLIKILNQKEDVEC